MLEKCTHEAHSKQRPAATFETIVLIYVCVIRTETLKLKLVLNLFGLSMHNLKTFFLMLLVTDVAASALLSATEHDVIQRVKGGVEMFNYGKLMWILCSVLGQDT